MDLLRRNYGKLFILLLVGGLAAGAVMAKRGVQLDLGTYNGRKIELTTKSSTPTGPQIITSTSSFAGFSGGAVVSGAVPGAIPAVGAAAAAAGALGRATTGSVDGVNGKTITVIGTDGTTIRATVNETTTYANNLAITTADLKVGDQVTVIGQPSADGSTITATQMTVGAGVLGSVPTVGRQGGGAGAGAATGATAAGASATPGAGRTGGQGAIGATGGAGAQGAGQFAGFGAVTGTIQKIDGNAITVAVEGGQPVKVIVTPDTRLRKVVSATLSDVKPGVQATIAGTVGADGTVAAQSVQLGSTR